jgi:hypothetical protein
LSIRMVARSLINVSLLVMIFTNSSIIVENVSILKTLWVKLIRTNKEIFDLTKMAVNFLIILVAKSMKKDI